MAAAGLLHQGGHKALLCLKHGTKPHEAERLNPVKRHQPLLLTSVPEGSAIASTLACMVGMWLLWGVIRFLFCVFGGNVRPLSLPP